MAVIYDWVIEKMNCYPEYAGEQDVVFNIFWRLNGTDGDFSATIYGSIPITYESGSLFTPYANLTKNQVVDWVKSALGDETVIEYEKSIEGQINSQKNTTVIAPQLPWA